VTTCEVLLFAQAAEAAGTRRLTLEARGPVSVDAFLQQVAAAQPALQPWIGRVAVAVNERYVRRDATIRPGDRVALLPPVSGG
jgi:molybdopterin converting factor subunit 1